MTIQELHKGALMIKRQPFFLICIMLVTPLAAVAKDCNFGAGKVNITLVGRATEKSQGVVDRMGIFEIVNDGVTSLAVPGYREGNYFFVWYPDAQLQVRDEQANWRNVFDNTAGSYAKAPDKLVVAPNSRALFFSSITTVDSTVSKSMLIRLVVDTANPAGCISSVPFSQQ